MRDLEGREFKDEKKSRCGDEKGFGRGERDKGSDSKEGRTDHMLFKSKGEEIKEEDRRRSKSN